jgi:hypothetical protein
MKNTDSLDKESMLFGLKYIYIYICIYVDAYIYLSWVLSKRPYF